MNQNNGNILTSVTNQLISALDSIIAFLPSLISALVILVIGLIVAGALRAVAKRLLDTINARRWFDKAGIEGRHHDTWGNVISQIVYWAVLILFLVPVFDTLHLQQVNQLLNQLVLYLPKVIAAVIISFIGIIFANLLSQLSSDAVQSYGRGVSSVVSTIARYSILVFTGLIVLNLLGIAAALIQIFLTGLMGGLALAFGLAFGLGGRDFASGILNGLRNLPKTVEKNNKK